MKTLLTTAILLVLALSSTAWACGHDRHDECHEPRACPPADQGPDLNGDGRVTNYERIRYARKERFERMHGS